MAEVAVQYGQEYIESLTYEQKVEKLDELSIVPMLRHGNEKILTDVQDFIVTVERGLRRRFHHK